MHVRHLLVMVVSACIETFTGWPDNTFLTTVCKYRMYFTKLTHAFHIVIRFFFTWYLFVMFFLVRLWLIMLLSRLSLHLTCILRGSCLRTISFLFSTRSQCCILLSICSWNYGFQIQIPRPHDCLLWPISLCVSRKAGHRSLQPGSLCVRVGRQNWDCISR